MQHPELFSIHSENYLEFSEWIPYFQGRMISRLLLKPLYQRLHQSPAVALLGSRQVGKTTLARELDPGKPTHYLDLEAHKAWQQSRPIAASS